MSKEECEAEDLLENLMQQGKTLETKLQQFDSCSIKGIDKLLRKLNAELKFLDKLKAHPSRMKIEKLRCSNLYHLGALVECLCEQQQVIAVLQPFSAHSIKVDVDVVCQGGSRWVKVIARNPQALHTICAGMGGGYGGRTVLDQSLELLFCARHHPHLFVPPQVCMVFTAGVSSSLASRLEDENIKVSGRRLSDVELGVDHLHLPEESSILDEMLCNCDYAQKHFEDLPPSPCDSKPSRLNLDVTAMIAYVSALTNGRAAFQFREPILTEQAAWERERPVKPILDKLFEGCELICCESAKNHFLSVVDTIGGKGEIEMTKELMSRICVVPDKMSMRTKRLQVGGKVKDRSRMIFGTGDELQIPTVTANSGFYRAALGQGINFATILHESRALTEGKEKNAIPLDLSS